MNLAGCHDIDSFTYKKKVINKADIFERYFTRYFSLNNIELIVRNNLKVVMESLYLNFDKFKSLYKDENGEYMNLGAKTIDILSTVTYYEGVKDDIFNYHYLPVNVEVNIKMNRKYKKKLYGKI